MTRLHTILQGHSPLCVCGGTVLAFGPPDVRRLGREGGRWDAGLRAPLLFFSARCPLTTPVCILRNSLAHTRCHALAFLGKRQDVRSQAWQLLEGKDCDALLPPAPQRLAVCTCPFPYLHVPTHRTHDHRTPLACQVEGPHSLASPAHFPPPTACL